MVYILYARMVGAVGLWRNKLTPEEVSASPLAR